MKTFILLLAFGAVTTVQLVGSNWIATTSSDLNTATNWDPNVVPGPGDEANFDNTVSGINLNPSITGTNFSVADVNFVNQAQPFTFQINDAALILNNLGITGTNTNATFNISNVDTVLPYPDQVTIPSALGSAIYNISNSGTATPSTPATSHVGYIPHFQVTLGDCTIGTGMQMNISNTGVDNSTAGSNLVGYVDNQGLITGNITGGDKVSIIYTNSGTNNTSTGNTVGYIGNPQIGLEGSSTTFGNNLNLYCSNNGVNHSQVSGANIVGHIGDPQMEYGNIVALDNATFTSINMGVNTGVDNTGQAGYVSGLQHSGGSLSAGNFLTIIAKNSGQESGSNGGNNNVGYVYGDQVFLGSLHAGDNATITISNQGTDSSPQTTNFVGYVNGNQFQTGTATLGKNSTINVTNSATNTGGSSNVGYVNGSQMYFGGLLTIDDGTSITSTNTGTLNNSPQINLPAGFTLVSGAASITAINQGTIGSAAGIDIRGSAPGGDVSINLTNSTLYVDTTGSPFTIGALNGDNTSSAVSVTPLIIATDPNVTAAFNGPYLISSLTKSGLGSQTLSGSGIAVSTTVDQGILNLTGTLTGTVGIDTAGILTGTGTVIGAVTNSGTISPGQSIGTLTFSSYTNNPSGAYDVEVNGQGQSDLIEVTSVADILGGPVVVSTVDGTYKFDYRYTIVEAGSVTGQYASVNPVSPLITAQLSKDAQHVYLSLVPNFSLAGRTHNERAVAAELDGITNPNAIQNKLLSQIANLTIPQATAALDSVSGSQHTNDYLTSYFVNRQFIRRLYDPIRSIVTTNPCCNPCPNGWTAYVEGGGSFVQLRRNSECHGFNSNGDQITAGVQGTFGRSWTVGVAGSYEYDQLHFKDHGGSARNQTGLVGLYGLYRPQCFYTFVDVTYGYGFNDVHRLIQVGSNFFHAFSKPNLSQVTGYAEIGVDLPLYCFLIQPFVGIEGTNYWRDHFVEAPAGGWELEVYKRSRASATSRAGLHLTTCLDGIDVSFDVAWNASLTNWNNAIREEFVQFGSPIDVWGVNLDWNSVDYALTLSSLVAPSTRVYLEAAGESWNKANYGTIQAGLLFTW